MRLERLLKTILVSTFLGIGAGASLAASPIGGLGILGDSASDEYRADDNRGGAYAETTLNWMELLVRQRGIDAGPWGGRSEPRRSGYAYNWARSGAVAADLIDTGQATGLAAQVAAGNVSTVVIMVGANDFAIWNGTYSQVYSGTVSGLALTEKVDGIVDSLRQAVEALQAAGPARIFIATLSDRGSVPVFQQTFPDAAKRQRVTDAIVRVNDGIRQLALDRGVVVVDFYTYGSTLLPRFDANGNLDVGGELISFAESGDEPHHLLLADNDHAGTVASGLIANYFIGAFASAGLEASPFTDAEILVNAGITVAPPDTQPPAVSFASPAAGAIVSGSIAVAATASDDTGVEGLQFMVDGSALGAEDRQAPYSVTLNASSLSNGEHQLAARARDAAGNATTATRAITVRNDAIARADSASVTQGKLQSGTVASVASDDNQFYVVRSGTSGLTGVASATFGFSGVARNATRLVFEVVEKS